MQKKIPGKMIIMSNMAVPVMLNHSFINHPGSELIVPGWLFFSKFLLIEKNVNFNQLNYIISSCLRIED